MSGAARPTNDIMCPVQEFPVRVRGFSYSCEGITELVFNSLQLTKEETGHGDQREERGSGAFASIVLSNFNSPINGSRALFPVLEEQFKFARNYS